MSFTILGRVILCILYLSNIHDIISWCGFPFDIGSVAFSLLRPLIAFGVTWLAEFTISLKAWNSYLSSFSPHDLLITNLFPKFCTSDYVLEGSEGTPFAGLLFFVSLISGIAHCSYSFFCEVIYIFHWFFLCCDDLAFVFLLPLVCLLCITLRWILLWKDQVPPRVSL